MTSGMPPSDPASRRARAVLPEGWPQPRGYANGMVAEGKVLMTGGLVGWAMGKANKGRKKGQASRAAQSLVDHMKAQGVPDGAGVLQINGSPTDAAATGMSGAGETVRRHRFDGGDGHAQGPQAGDRLLASLARILWLPPAWVPQWHAPLQFGEYCLLRRAT